MQSILPVKTSFGLLLLSVSLVCSSCKKDQAAVKAVSAEDHVVCDIAAVWWLALGVIGGPEVSILSGLAGTIGNGFLQDSSSCSDKPQPLKIADIGTIIGDETKRASKKIDVAKMSALIDSYNFYNSQKGGDLRNYLTDMAGTAFTAEQNFDQAGLAGSASWADARSMRIYALKKIILKDTDLNVPQATIDKDTNNLNDVLDGLAGGLVAGQTLDQKIDKLNAEADDAGKSYYDDQDSLDVVHVFGLPVRTCRKVMPFSTAEQAYFDGLKGDVPTVMQKRVDLIKAGSICSDAGKLSDDDMNNTKHKAQSAAVKAKLDPVIADLTYRLKVDLIGKNTHLTNLRTAITKLQAAYPRPAGSLGKGQTVIADPTMNQSNANGT